LLLTSSEWAAIRCSARPVDFIIEVEEDAEANVCKAGMCRFGKNVIVSYERRSSTVASRSDVKYSLTEK
jgi:hypothetical protein